MRCGSLRFEVFRVEMALDAAAPSSHKRKIQRSADGGAGKGNTGGSRLLGGLGANPGGKTFGDARSEFLEKLFLGQILAAIDTGGSRGRLPHFDPLVATVSLKTVEQRKTLDEPQGDNREQAGIRQKRDHATQAESRAFRKRQAFRIANQRCRDSVQAFRGNVLHAREVRDPQLVLVRKLPPEVFGVNLDRAQSAENSKPQKAAEGPPRQRPFERIV